MEKVEVKRLVNMQDPYTLYYLPSGFPNKEIEVYEDPYGTLEVKYVPKNKRAEDEA